jgi:hypothetical protein
VVRIWQLSDWKPIKDLGKRRGSDFDGYHWIHAISLSAEWSLAGSGRPGGFIQVCSLSPTA